MSLRLPGAWTVGRRANPASWLTSCLTVTLSMFASAGAPANAVVDASSRRIA